MSEAAALLFTIVRLVERNVDVGGYVSHNAGKKKAKSPGVHGF